MSNQLTIKESVDVRKGREAVREFAAACHFETLACEELALVTSEICENVIKHADEGILSLSTEKKGRVLVIRLEDKGPGIADISLAMEEGFSSVRGSLGLGLDVVRRLVDEMTIHSEVDKGTTVIVKKFLPLTEDIVDYGIISISDENYWYNGDQYLIKEFDGDSVLLAVADGIGQGFNAYLASAFTAQIMASNYRLPLLEIVEYCHEMLQKSDLEGGVALSLAVLTPGKLLYIGIGDTHAYWVAKDKLHLLKSAPGRVGYFQFKKPEVQEITFTKPITVCLCSDGIQEPIIWKEMKKEVSAQQLAKQIFNNHHRSYGDSTVLVTNYKLSE